MYSSSVTGALQDEQGKYVDGIITIYQDSVRCFIEPFGYAKFKIELYKETIDDNFTKDESRDDQVAQFNIIASRPGVKLFIYGDKEIVEQILFIENGDEVYRNYVTMIRYQFYEGKKKKITKKQYDAAINRSRYQYRNGIVRSDSSVLNGYHR